MLPEQASNHDGRTSTLPRGGQGVRGSGAWRKWRGKVTQSRSCDYWEKRHGAKSINDRERQVVESHIESWKTTSGCSIHFHWGHIAQRHLLRRYKRLKTALKRGNKNITFSYNYQEATRGGMKIVKLTKQTDNWSGSHTDDLEEPRSDFPNQDRLQKQQIITQKIWGIPHLN